MSELTDLGVRESRDLLQRQQITALELTSAYLERIAAFNPALHAYIEVFPENARTAAKASDLARGSGHTVGPLQGIPFALKDLVHVKGLVTTGGSKTRVGVRADATAEISRRLFAAGMIFLGKTHTVEFAFGAWGTNEHMGTPRNPWVMNERRVPGGSSSGSAVAVASRMAPWAIGTDTGGSVRIPSAFCGLTGLKLTVGTVPTNGILPLSPTLDSIGPLARSAEDVAILFGVMAGKCGAAGDTPVVPRQRLKGLVIGAIDDRCRAVVSKSVLDAYDNSLKGLASLGAEITILKSLPDFDRFTDVASSLMAMELYSLNRAVLDDDSAPIDSQVRARVRNGLKLFGGEYLNVLRAREGLASALDAALSEVDAFVTPTVPVTAIAETNVLTTKINPGYFTRPVNISGRCALALPNGIDEVGLPTSLQIICGAFEETMCLRIGQILQSITEWHLRSPTCLNSLRAETLNP